MTSTAAAMTPETEANPLDVIAGKLSTRTIEIMAQENVNSLDESGYEIDYTIQKPEQIFAIMQRAAREKELKKEVDDTGIINLLSIDPSAVTTNIVEQYSKFDQSKLKPNGSGRVKLDDVNGDDAPDVKAKSTTYDPIRLLDNAMVPAINTMLLAATGGKASNIANMLDFLNNSQSKITLLEHSLAAANEKAMKAVMDALPKTGTETINGEELTYDVVYQSANDIFAPMDSAGRRRKTKSLEFQIPTLVWKDSTGKTVAHPEVPALDDNYQIQPMHLLKFLTAFVHGTNTWLYGHTGTGKSTFVQQIASRIGFPVARVNLDSFLERSDFVGHTVLREKGGATVSQYEEGTLPRAMKRPGFLLLDEIDAGRPDILFVIQRVLEDGNLMLTEDHGRIVKAHPLFRFTSTANTRGQGDEYGIYQGTRTLNTALIDRFPVFIEFTYLKKDVEMKLIKSRHPDIDDNMLEQIVVFANEVRAAFMNGELFQPITPRGLNVLTEMFLHFNKVGVSAAGKALQMSLEMTVYDRTTRDTVQKVKELADRCFMVKDAA